MKKIFTILLLFLILSGGERNNQVRYPNQQQRIPRDLIGNVNQDGAINISDVIQVVGIIMGFIEHTEYMLWASDVNFDNNVVYVKTVWMATNNELDIELVF